MLSESCFLFTFIITLGKGKYSLFFILFCSLGVELVSFSLWSGKLSFIEKSLSDSEVLHIKHLYILFQTGGEGLMQSKCVEAFFLAMTKSENFDALFEISLFGNYLIQGYKGLCKSASKYKNSRL